MGRYIARRLLQAIPVFFGATFIIFALVFWLPGDPIRALSGDRPLPEAIQAEMRDRYNLDDNVFVQYGKYMGIIPNDPAGDTEGGFQGIFQGNFGTNFRGRPVRDIVGDAYPFTIKLALVAFVFEAIVGLIAGVLAGLRAESFIDNLVKVATVSLISIPVFVLGYVAQLVVGVELGWLPIAFDVEDGLKAYFMPGMILAALSLASIARLTRTQIIENIRSDYVRTARAKGLSSTRVTLRHLLRNSLIPVVTFLGADLGALMGGAIITESIFNVPGIGREVLAAINQQEGTVVVGIVTILVLIFVTANLLVDLLYAALDPRIRYE